jgi:glycosyltransferase involved in cell wall biosynthesis
MAHHLETILESAEIAQGNGDNFQFILLGNGSRKQNLVEMASEMKLKNVIFVNSVSKDEVARYWSLLDVSIIHLKKMDLFTSVIPSKLFECMAMGIPVLLGVKGESADIVQTNKVGLIFEPENARQLYDRLVELKEDSEKYLQFQKNALIAANKYDRISLAREFESLLSQFSKHE